MHNQVGVAADRRGKMRVAAQIEPKVSVIFGGILGLRLVRRTISLTNCSASRPFTRARTRLKIPASAAGLFESGYRACAGIPAAPGSSPSSARHARDRSAETCAFQRFGSGDVRQDHEFLDQPMRFKPLGRDHAVDGALPFRRILRSGRSRSSGWRSQRALSPLFRRRHRAAPVPARASTRYLVGRGRRSPIAPAVRQLGGRTHQDAVECVRAFAAVGADDHPHGERRRDPRGPAASTGRSRCAPAASARRGRGNKPSCRVQGFAVERGARLHVMGDIGDGDIDDEAAGFVRRGISLGMHRIVVIFGVRRIDGDEGHAAASLRGREQSQASQPPPPVPSRAGILKVCCARG